jgi:tRNA (guanine-N7-)-methyltransferase
MDHGNVEFEHGIPIPGEILPESRWAKTALKRLPEPGPLNWDELFGRSAPVVLDLGCGNGRYTLLSALARPELNHMAVDVLPVVIRYATRRANQRGLENVRIAVKDAQTFLRNYVGDASVAEIHLYHPQPFHDSRKRHLRIVTRAFLADIHRALVPSGRFFVQTDNPHYWSSIKAALPEFFHFEERPGPWPDAPEGRTRREIVARQRGLPIFRGVGIRRDDREIKAPASRKPPEVEPQEQNDELAG